MSEVRLTVRWGRWSGFGRRCSAPSSHRRPAVVRGFQWRTRVELSAEQLETFFRGWAIKFALGELPAAERFTARERAVIDLAACYFVVRFPQARVMHAGLCFVASKVVRAVARAQGMRAEPLTVTLAAYDGGGLSLGSKRPRIKRLSMELQTLREWSGHEIVHFPEHASVFDPTIPQLSTLDVPVRPVVGEAPATVREGDRIPAVLPPTGVGAAYTVEQANFGCMKMPFWADVEQFSNDGIEIVGRQPTSWWRICGT
jgi:hypothetical protein